MQLTTLSGFFAAALLLGFMPGPDNIFVMMQSAMRGIRAGGMVILGLCTGLLVHTTAVTVGVAVIFQRSQLAFDLLKYAGAAYLLYLAWQAFRARPVRPLAAGEQTVVTVKQLYLRGIVMNISNPKVSLFFLAFLPQFVNQRAGHTSLQMLVLGGMFIVATILSFGVLAWAAAKIGTQVNQSPRAQLFMNRIAGTVFAGLAIKLATTHQ